MNRVDRTIIWIAVKCQMARRASNWGAAFLRALAES
jgi:hypothetical protein